MRLIHLLEQWANDRKSRWLAKIDFQDNSDRRWIVGTPVASSVDHIWVGCIGIASVDTISITFHLGLNKIPIQGPDRSKNVSDPDFFQWIDRKFVEAGIFKAVS